VAVSTTVRPVIETALTAVKNAVTKLAEDPLVVAAGISKRMVPMIATDPKAITTACAGRILLSVAAVELTPTLYA